MHALSCALFAFALPAQVSAPAPQPRWLTDLQKIQQEMHQAPLGSLDGTVERAWAAALETPQHPQFQMAAQVTSSFYQSQGYDLKAEQVLRQALAAVAEGDAQTRRNLASQLAGHFESAQQLVKALAIREEIANEQQLDPPASYEAIALANLCERMGELEKAEAAWKEVALRRATESSARASGSAPRAFVGPFSHGYASGAENELANFYARHGRAAEAERIYKKALAGAAQSSSPYDWNGAADGYIGFLTQQRRFDDAVDLSRRIIARIERSSDPHTTRMLLYKRQHLSGLLAQAGRPDEALAVQKEAVEAAQADGFGTPEHAQALGSLAQTLINQNRLEEAEKVAAQMREAGAADAPNARFHESMAAQTLARIRDMQKRPEEAQQLRASVGVPDLTATTVFDLVGPAQQAALQGNVDVAVAAADRAIALSAERARTNPQEVSGLMSLAHVLMSKQREGEARRIAVATLQILEQAPDHPRVADALGSVTSPLANLGMTAEAERVIERQERILIGAKGAESLALNSIGYGRVALMQRDSNWAGVIAERKRMLARTEKATGTRSRESLYALREVAWAYPSIHNWPEEEPVLLALLDRPLSLSGKSSLDHAHLLVHMANRASQNRQFDKALSWMDQAIEVTRALPDASVHLPAMAQNRAQIAQVKDGPPGGPFYAPARVPANSDGRWFDADRFQRTDGTRLGNRPAGAVLMRRPAVIRGGTANAPVAAPGQAPPPPPAKR